MVDVHFINDWRPGDPSEIFNEEKIGEEVHFIIHEYLDETKECIIYTKYRIFYKSKLRDKKFTSNFLHNILS